MCPSNYHHDYRDIAEGSMQYVWEMLPAMYAFTFFDCTKNYLQSMGIHYPVVIIQSFTSVSDICMYRFYISSYLNISLWLWDWESGEQHGLRTSQVVHQHCWFTSTLLSINHSILHGWSGIRGHSNLLPYLQNNSLLRVSRTISNRVHLKSWH